MSRKKPPTNNRYMWRDADSGRLGSVVVADPAVRPTSVTIEKMRKAVREVAATRSDRSSRRAR